MKDFFKFFDSLSWYLYFNYYVFKGKKKIRIIKFLRDWMDDPVYWNKNIEIAESFDSRIMNAICVLTMSIK